MKNENLESLITFAEASEYLGKSPAFMNDMVSAGYLLEGIHYRKAGRVKLVLKDVVEQIKAGTFKKETEDLRMFYSKGYTLGSKLDDHNKAFVKNFLLTLLPTTDDTSKELIKLFVANECEFPAELVSEEYSGDKRAAAQCLMIGINNGMGCKL